MASAEISPYYVAICECGWLGEIRDAADYSREDALAHSSNVADEIRRPLEELNPSGK